MEPIATTLLGSAAGSITFSNIPQGYKHLQIRGIGLYSSTVTSALFRFNGDTGTNYAYHELYGDGSTASSGPATSVTYGILGPLNNVQFSGYVVDILDYTNTNKYKTVRSLSGVDKNGSGNIAFNSSLWLNAAAITSISLFPYSANFATNTRFSLYGIKG
jgi:hypothetical protein